MLILNVAVFKQVSNLWLTRQTSTDQFYNSLKKNKAFLLSEIPNAVGFLVKCMSKNCIFVGRLVVLVQNASKQ